MFQPNSPSTRAMVAGAGGAPAVRTRTPRGASLRSSCGACATPMSTVGAAHKIVTASAFRLEDSRRLHAAQAHVRGARGGDGPGEGPAVGVEHRQRPQV